MSSSDEFLKKRQQEIKGKAEKITPETNVTLSLKIVNEMLHNQERLTTAVTALNDEIKTMQKKGGQQTLA